MILKTSEIIVGILITITSAAIVGGFVGYMAVLTAVTRFDERFIFVGKEIDGIKQIVSNQRTLESAVAAHDIQVITLFRQVGILEEEMREQQRHTARHHSAD